MAAAVLTERNALGQNAPTIFDAALETVSVSVTARDKDGRLVTDLSRDDFRVYENGRPRPIDVFGRAAPEAADALLSLDIALLVDLSGSVSEDTKAIREAAFSFLDKVPNTRRILFTPFDSKPQVLAYESTNREGLSKWLGAASSYGGTALNDAVVQTLSRFTPGAKRRVLVILSDGDDTVSTSKPDAVKRALQQSGAVVYAASFAGGLQAGTLRAFTAHEWLKQMTTTTGGRLFKGSAKDAGRLFETMLEELAAQYVIGFEPQAHGSGGFRKIRVESNQKDVRLRYRAGYYAPKRARP